MQVPGIIKNTGIVNAGFKRYLMYQPNEKRYAILAYSKDGAPLVKRKDSEGYVKDNQGGPIKVIIESQTSKWVNSVQEIIINK